MSGVVASGHTVSSDEDERSRFVVGIDLGTTNCALAFVDTNRTDWRVETFDVTQFVAAGELATQRTLPSFLYQPAEGELGDEARTLPWHEGPQAHVVGVAARELGRDRPDRMIASAKSWLCHPGVDRTDAILPWHGAADCQSISPVEASAKILTHLRDAWDAVHPSDPLAEQDVVITLPASFDEVARELTVQAAREAGLPRVVLIEEPQAAFYAWIHRHRDDWHTLVQPGQTVLVCDIGGGTSDLTLIQARQTADGLVDFQRRAVGKHLLLGGDNLDLAIAHHIETQLGGQLPASQWNSLVRQARQVKETLLAADAPKQTSVSISSRGRSLVGSAKQATVDRNTIRALLLGGFLPEATLTDRPDDQITGFQEFGLPYASDAAISKHLAAFLSTHRRDDDPHPAAVRPDLVLFNGGFFASPVLRDRVSELLDGWFDGHAITTLDHDDLHEAVARGAAYYGMVRRGEGVKIAAGLPRTFYVGVDGETAVCVAPAGLEPGEPLAIETPTFELTLSQPVEFPIYSSSVRLDDAAGDVVSVDEGDVQTLPPIRTVLRGKSKKKAGRAIAEVVPVRLEAGVSEIGTLELACRGIDDANAARRWRLQFDVRSATQTDQSGHTGVGETEGVLEDTVVEAACDVVRQTFGDPFAVKPRDVMERLEDATGLSREQWPPTLLRRLWDELIIVEPGRRQSSAHEPRFLNLLGYCLRPGYGVALDDWRVGQTFKRIAGKLAFGQANSIHESRVLWRRVAGGLTAGQQQSLVEPLMTVLREDSVDAETWRMLGALERLPVSLKETLGELALTAIDDDRIGHAAVWALGRWGARQPTYAPLNAVLRPDIAAQWSQRVMQADQPTSPLAVAQLVRKTADRFRDVDDMIRDEAASWLAGEGHEEFTSLVQEGGVLSTEQQDATFGEALPRGLRLVR